MENNITSLRSEFSVNYEASDKDTRFMQVTIDVMHTGENFNKSFFDKEIVNNCIESIKNTPVLGFVKYDKATGESDFQGHEYIITRTENGIENMYCGRAYGIIPESCNPRWFTKMCTDGVEREFLQVDALLWEKFSDCTNILRRDAEKAESMELEIGSIDGYEDDNGIFHFEKFRFEGCCLLGSDCDPAMIDANVKMSEVQFSKDDFVKSIQSEFNDKLETFNATFAKLIGEEKGQGGVRNMPNTDFAQTVLEQFEDMAIMVNQQEIVKDYWGYDVPRYYMADVQDDEVIVVDRSDSYRYYGFKFALSGDKPEIDFSCGNRKKLRFENYEDGTAAQESAFDFGKHIAEIEEAAFAKVDEVEKAKQEIEQEKEDISTDYSKVKAEFEEIKPKYEEYVLAEENRKAEEISAEKDAKFAEYEDVLAENAEFTALKEKKDELSVEDIEKECAVLYVKTSRPKNNFSKTTTVANATIGVLEDSDPEDDGVVHTRYGDIRIKE